MEYNRWLMNADDFDPAVNLARASTIPSSWYTDPEILALETEKIFRRTWQCVGRLEMVQHAGDFFTCEVAGEPLVVVRGSDQVLRAFSNVCRHRAGPVATGQGNRSSLQCRYHGWTYSLDGRLLAAPEFEGVQDWNKSEVCLSSNLLEAWGPFLFANLDPKAPPLRQMLDGIVSEVEQAGIDIAAMRFFERRDYVVECNWKAYVDNYVEGYHIPLVHPALFRTLDYEQYRVEPHRYHSSQHAPIRGAKTDQDSRALYYWVFPNFMISVYPGNVQTNVIVPLSHNKTLTIFEWLCLPSTDAETVRQGVEFSHQVQIEDIAICESVQKGLSSRSYTSGRYSVKRENGVHHFHTLLHEFLHT